MSLKPIADGLFQLSGFPPNAVNIYVMGDVLVDAGTRFDRGRILRQTKGRTIQAHTLTHAHPDHQGCSRAVCELLKIPFWCGEHDTPAAEDPAVMLGRMPKYWVNRWVPALFGGPGRQVDRMLREGDEVAGFTVIDTPGHSVGHISYWRERDRVLVLGDVLANMNYLTGLPGLHEPPVFFSTDPAQNRASVRKVAALRPEVVVFGHGPPLRDPDRLQRFVDRMPSP